MIKNNKFLKGNIILIGSTAVVGSAFNTIGNVSAVSSEDINKILEEKFIKKGLVAYKKLENSDVFGGTLMDSAYMFNDNLGYGYYRNYNKGTLVLCKIENDNKEGDTEYFKYTELCEFCENNLDPDKAQKFYDLLKKVLYKKECQDFYYFLKKNSGGLLSSGKLFSTHESLAAKNQYFIPSKIVLPMGNYDYLSSIMFVFEKDSTVKEVQIFGVNKEYCIGENVETSQEKMIELMKEVKKKAEEKINSSYADVSKSNESA